MRHCNKKDDSESNYKKSLVKKCVNMLLFSCSVVSSSLWPHELQHSRLTHPSLSPRVCSNSCAHWVDDAIQPSHPLLPSSPPCLSLPQIRIFSSQLALHIRWPKCWSFSISPYNEYSVLISFRIDSSIKKKYIWKFCV